MDHVVKEGDRSLEFYNTKRPHEGRGMKGYTPYEVFVKGLPKSPAAAKPKALTKEDTKAA